MRISNVGLFVKDLEGARKFFEDFFGAQVHATYEEDDGYKSYIMKFDENPKLELMSADRRRRRRTRTVPALCISASRSTPREADGSRSSAANYTIPSSLQRTAAMRSAPSFEDNILEVCC
ncbi:MAG: VOC family protein [Oscillospiraceae bacterium]